MEKNIGFAKNLVCGKLGWKQRNNMEKSEGFSANLPFAKNMRIFYGIRMSLSAANIPIFPKTGMSLHGGSIVQA